MIAELVLAAAASFSMPTGQIGAGRCALINGGILTSYETGGITELDVLELRTAPDRGVWIDATIGVDVYSQPGTGNGVGDSWTAVIVDDPVTIDRIARAAQIYPARDDEPLALEATYGVTSGDTWPWLVGGNDFHAPGFSVQGGGFFNTSQFVEPRFYVGPGKVLYIFTSQRLTPFTVLLYAREDVLPGETGSCTLEPDPQRRLSR